MSTSKAREIIGRTAMFNSWERFLLTLPREKAISHCSASSDILEIRLRALGKRRGYTTRAGFKKRELERVIGMALGIHKQLGFLFGAARACRASPVTGRIEGGGRVKTKIATVGSYRSATT